MTDGQDRALEERMERMERRMDEGFRRLELILQGDLSDPKNEGGLSGVIRRNREQLHDHEKRIGEVEKIAISADRWIQDRNAQWRLLLLMGGGNVAGLLYVLWQLAQLAR